MSGRNWHRETENRTAQPPETVLLIDDEEIVLDVVCQMVRKMGYEVLAARSGAEALKIYKRWHDRIDVVILDMMMPDMSGAETLARLQKIKKDVKVLLSTGYGLNDQAAEMMSRGCAGFMDKPYRIGDLRMKIHSMLHHNPSGVSNKAMKAGGHAVEQRAV